jgi:hypothetical protein
VSRTAGWATLADGRLALPWPHSAPFPGGAGGRRSPFCFCAHAAERVPYGRFPFVGHPVSLPAAELPEVGAELARVVDCHDADVLVDFWAKALDYVREPPPAGFETWEAFLQANDIPLPEPGTIGAVVDPDSVGPRVLFQSVPEGKTVKNRFHLDARAGDRRDEKVTVLEAAGGTVLQRVTKQGRTWVVMADPEGNELCVTGAAPITDRPQFGSESSLVRLSRGESIVHVRAGADVVRLAYPTRKFVIELVQAGYSELVHEEPLGVRRCTLNAQVPQFPLQVQVAIE